MNNLVESEIHTDDELVNTVKKVVIDESKNTIQDAPIPALKPDTPKIALPQFEYKYLVIDTFTDNSIGLYKSNKIAVEVVKNLVKDDLNVLILSERMKILQNDSVEENRQALQNIKQWIYHVNTIDQNNNTMYMIDGKVVNRYRIHVVKEGDKDVDESNYSNL
jgi:hypothetical protein